MTPGWQSLVTVGQSIRGVCYASPTKFMGNPFRLTAIPPERIGLHGEYDHYGLSKRIQARFQDRLGPTEAAKLLIRQRGSAIVLSGYVECRATLEELVMLAMQTEGATQVEVYDVQLGHQSTSHCQVLQVA